MLRVVFRASKGHGATGHARGGGLHLAQEERQTDILEADGSYPSLLQ